MNCKNCGRELTEETVFCPVCGTCMQKQSSAPIPKPTLEFRSTEYESYDTNPVMYDEGREIRSEIKPKSHGNMAAKIALVTAIVIVLTAIAYVVFTFFNSSTSSAKGLSITIEDVPNSTKKEVYALNGKASAPNSKATITINGEFVKSIDANEKDVAWEKEFQLENGKNTFYITIVTANGDSITEKVVTNRDVNAVYKEGTVLVKKSTSGVYIRPTPNISNKYVMLIDQNDYKSRFVCLGKETTDSEGYIWCRVQTPSSGAGWVRTDLMKVVE